MITELTTYDGHVIQHDTESTNLILYYNLLLLYLNNTIYLLYFFL